jgi:hypothetical protein
MGDPYGSDAENLLACVQSSVRRIGFQDVWPKKTTNWQTKVNGLLTDDYRRSILPYDSIRYPFREIMESHLAVGSLELLHNHFYMPKITAENDQEAPLHREMYRIGPAFGTVYRKFVQDWVQPIIGSSVVFQKVPSLRYQAPGTVAVGAWHRDSDFGHGRGEINVWVPLTSSEPSSSVWLESQPDRGDFGPAMVPFGCAMLFDAVSLMHGNVINTSQYTRVSFEFRVIKESAYGARSERSVKQRKRFQVGDYFDRLPSADFSGPD